MAKLGDIPTTDELASGGTTILNGSGPPADALGVDGDYYLDTVAKILYGPKAAGSGFGPGVSMVTATPSGSQGANVNTSEGARFKTLATGRITGLRYYRWAGNVNAHAITLILWAQASQTELARVVINNAANQPAGWVVGALTAPIPVVAGTDYRVAYSPGSGTTNVSYQAVGTITSAVPSLALYAGHCLSFTPNSYPSTDDATNCYFADIVIQPVGPWPVAIKSAP
jgi:Domain of unknown function (DUF4082)